jgi:hypothetical protein
MLLNSMHWWPKSNTTLIWLRWPTNNWVGDLVAASYYFPLSIFWTEWNKYFLVLSFDDCSRRWKLLFAIHNHLMLNVTLYNTTMIISFKVSTQTWKFMFSRSVTVERSASKAKLIRNQN